MLPFFGDRMPFDEASIQNAGKLWEIITHDFIMG
jgi:hypothetical protein